MRTSSRDNNNCGFIVTNVPVLTTIEVEILKRFGDFTKSIKRRLVVKQGLKPSRLLSKGVYQLPPPIKTFVTMSAKSADKNKKASKQQTHRWNLQGVPNILKRATLDYLFAHRAYVYKKIVPLLGTWI